MTDIAATIETFVELVTDFQVELDATSDQQLSDMKYHLYLVPASQQWEVIFDYVHPPGPHSASEPDMEPIYNGELTDFQRGQHILQSVVDEEYPKPAIAGPLTMVLLERQCERTLSSTFERMLPRLRTAARLLSSPDDEAVDESGADAGESVVPTLSTTPLPDDDESPNWIKITRAAELTAANKGTVSRWLNDGHVLDNKKKNRQRRVNVGSLLAYCESEGLSINET